MNVHRAQVIQLNFLKEMIGTSSRIVQMYHRPQLCIKRLHKDIIMTSHNFSTVMTSQWLRTPVNFSVVTGSEKGAPVLAEPPVIGRVVVVRP